MDHGHALGMLSHVDGVWVYVVVFLLILLQECGVPFPILPSEVVLLGCGFLVSQGKVSLIVAGLLATGATLLGNSLLFVISRRYGRAALDRYGKYVHMHTERVDRIERWIELRGGLMLFYGPLVPVLRAYVPALAGMFGVPYRVYIGVLTGAAVLWTFGMLILGALLGDHWFDAVDFIRHNITIGCLIIAVIAVALLLVRRWTRHITMDDPLAEPLSGGPRDSTTKRLSLKPQELQPWEERSS